MSEATGIDRATIQHYESGRFPLPEEHLERLAVPSGLTVAAGEEVLELADTLRQPRVRQGRGAEDLIAELGETRRVRRAWQQLLRMRLPARPPCPADRVQARELLSLLKELDEDQRLGAVQAAEQLHTWAFCIEAAEESRRAASRDVQEAAAWARLASEAVKRAQDDAAFLRKIQGALTAIEGNVLRVEGRIKAARSAFGPAQELWDTGSDPWQLLDPALLLDLEASLCRAERKFDAALDRLDRALKVGHYPERYLIKKGFTLEVMGEYERAVEALLKAAPRLDRQRTPRLWYQQRFNLAVNYTHLQRHSEAAGLLEGVREAVLEVGDEIFLIRLKWLEGRLAAGLGQREEALRLLGEAQQQFADRKMWYDVALALLEVTVLLLDEGRTAEVKELTPALAKVFESQDIHREALAALQLFQDAAEREEATAAFARKVLRFLFRARHDEEVRFGVR
jgi:tetratricopeptide (TPR) repeat protein